jgi:hypothetical protein
MGINIGGGVVALLALVLLLAGFVAALVVYLLTRGPGEQGED